MITFKYLYEWLCDHCAGTLTLSFTQEARMEFINDRFLLVAGLLPECILLQIKLVYEEDFKHGWSVFSFLIQQTVGEAVTNLLMLSVKNFFEVKTILRYYNVSVLICISSDLPQNLSLSTSTNWNVIFFATISIFWAVVLCYLRVMKNVGPCSCVSVKVWGKIEMLKCVNVLSINRKTWESWWPT